MPGVPVRPRRRGSDRDGLRWGGDSWQGPLSPLVVLWEDREGRKGVVRVRGFHVAESQAPAEENKARRGWCWALQWLFSSCFPRDLIRAPSQQLWYVPPPASPLGPGPESSLQ